MAHAGLYLPIAKHTMIQGLAPLALVATALTMEFAHRYPHFAGAKIPKASAWHAIKDMLCINKSVFHWAALQI